MAPPPRQRVHTEKRGGPVTRRVHIRRQKVFYGWQRPSKSYREELLRRQAELREFDLAEDEQLLAEWFALLAEVDRLVRIDHAKEDSVETRSYSYYKNVLLTRQAELLKVDMQQSEALLLEWYTLHNELEFVSRQQTVMARSNQTPIDELLREGRISIKPKQKQGASLHDIAAEGSHAQRHSEDLEPPFSKDAPSFVKSQMPDLTLEEFALLPPTERVETLITSIEGSTEHDSDMQWDNATLATKESTELKPTSWVQPSLDDLDKADLPSWLLGDDEFMKELLQEKPVWKEVPIDTERISEVDLQRQLAEKDEEIRLTQAKIELENSKKELAAEKERAKTERAEKEQLGVVVDPNNSADFNMELIERELELECREKELIADELKQDLRDLTEELGKARLGILQHPQIGELVDRANVFEALGTDVVVEPSLIAPQPSDLVLEKVAQDIPIIPDSLNMAQQGVMVDAATLTQIENQYLALREAALSKATQDNNISPAAEEWVFEQVAKARSSAEKLAREREALQSLLEEAEVTKDVRAKKYEQLALEETANQIKAVEKRAIYSQQMLKEDKARRDEEAKSNQLTNVSLDERAAVTNLRIKQWDEKVAVLQSHLEKRMDAMDEMNYMTQKLTGAKAIVLNESVQGDKEKAVGRVRRWRKRNSGENVQLDEEEDFNDDDWM